MNNAISRNNSRPNTSIVGDFSGYTLSNKNTISGETVSAKAIDSGSILPIEILVKIFIHCSLQDMGSLAQVNRLYRSAVYDALLGTLFLGKVRNEVKTKIRAINEMDEAGVETANEIDKVEVRIQTKKVMDEARILSKKKIINVFNSKEFKDAYADNSGFLKRNPIAYRVFQALFKNSCLDRFCEGDLLRAGKLLLNFDGQYIKRMPSSLIDIGICTQSQITFSSAQFDQDQWNFIVNEIPMFLSHPQKLNIEEFRKIPSHILKEGMFKQAIDQKSQWLEAFLNAGIKIKHSDLQKYEELMLKIIEGGLVNTFNLLIELGVDKNLFIPIYGSFLNYAIQDGSILIAESLIKMGADLNVLDEEGNATLQIAFHKGYFIDIGVVANSNIFNELLAHSDVQNETVHIFNSLNEAVANLNLSYQNLANLNILNEISVNLNILNGIPINFDLSNNIFDISNEIGESLKKLNKWLAKFNLLNEYINIAPISIYNLGCPPYIIKLLVQNGARVNAQNAREDMLLQSLIEMGSSAVAKHWSGICCSDSIFVTSSKAQYLAEALRMDLLKCLLEKPINLEETNTKGETALQAAFNARRSPDVIKLLVEKGANVNARKAQEETLLERLVSMTSFDVARHWSTTCCPNNISAASSEAADRAEALRMDLLKCLLEKSINLEETNTNGETALQAAFKARRSPAVIKLLVEKGANVNARKAKEETLLQSLVDMPSHRIALHWDAICCPNGISITSNEAEDRAEAFRMDLLKCFLKKPINLEELNTEGETVLQMAFRVGSSPGVIKLLVEKGANVNARKAQEETLLERLVSMTSTGVALHWPAICCPNNILVTSSEAADRAEALRMDLLKCFLKKIINLEKLNTEGETILQMAFRVGSFPDVIKLLVEKGANVNTRDAQEKTLLERLVSMTSYDVAMNWRAICCPNNILATSSKAADRAEALRMDLLKCFLKYGAEIKENLVLPPALCTELSLDILCCLLQSDANSYVRGVEKILLSVLMRMDNGQIVSHWGGSNQSEDPLAAVQALRIYLMENLLPKNFNPLHNAEDLKLLKLAKNHKNKESIVFLGSKMENTWEREIKVHYFRSFCIYLDRLWKRFQVWRLGGL